MKILAIIIALLLLLTLVACVSGGTPSKPTVVTHQCTDLATTSLKAQGEVTDDGGATLTRRGFYYSTYPLYGLEFDGIEDHVVLPAGSQPTGAFTLAIWCKPTDWEHADYPRLFGGRGLIIYEDGLSGITITRYQKWLYFDVADGANAARRTIAPLIDKIAPAGEWSFMILTNSGVAEAGGLNLWKNSAVPVGNTTGAATVRWLDNYCTLSRNGTNCFKGIIGEVRIYDRALDTTEIEALYNGQDVTGGLRGLWKLDKGSGDTAYDSSGNGNHGSLVNNPEWFIDGDIVDETGSLSTGTYSLNIVGLEPDTWYRIRAFAENELGIGYGNVVSCQTLE